MISVEVGDGGVDYADLAGVVEQGETVVFTRSGCPVAIMRPINQNPGAATETQVPAEPPVGTVYVDPEDGGVHVWTRRGDGWHCSRRECDNCPCTWEEVLDWLGGIERLTRYLPGEKSGNFLLDLGPDLNEPLGIVKAYRADRGDDAESVLDPTGKTMQTVCEVCGRRVIADPCLEHQPNAYDAVTRLRELSPDGRVPSTTYCWLMFGTKP